MIDLCERQFNIILEIYSEIKPELYLKLVGDNIDFVDFHHTLWELPFYQKIIYLSSNINTTKYLFVSDRNVSSSNLFFLYEISYSIFSLKGTFKIEKHIIDINENPTKFIKYLSIVLASTNEVDDVPEAVINYTIFL
jgi:hypothetical protein